MTSIIARGLRSLSAGTSTNAPSAPAPITASLTSSPSLFVACAGGGELDVDDTATSMNPSLDVDGTAPSTNSPLDVGGTATSTLGEHSVVASRLARSSSPASVLGAVTS